LQNRRLLGAVGVDGKSRDDHHDPEGKSSERDLDVLCDAHTEAPRTTKVSNNNPSPNPPLCSLLRKILRVGQNRPVLRAVPGANVADANALLVQRVLSYHGLRLA
jgi:hypothetical protein